MSISSKALLLSDSYNGLFKAHMVKLFGSKQGDAKYRVKQLSFLNGTLYILKFTHFGNF